eukprot:Em0004g1332a
MKWYSRGEWIALLCLLDAVKCVVLLSGPQDLDTIKDNSSVIVVGSVIQLFCSASGQLTAPHIQWTRNNITIPETAQLPHLMVKSRTQNNTITSSLLTVYGFSSSDNGSYQCVACNNNSCNTSVALLLSASSGSNVLKIVRELSNNTADRTSVPLGSSDISSNGGFLRCSAEQSASSSLTAPSMMWLKDGTQLFGDGVRVVINTTNSTIGTSNRTVSFVRIFNFSQSDAGVYQCVFYDTPSQGGEVVTTRPYKVDTGHASMVLVSTTPITLSPPDPLVIQVEAGGEYAGIQWTRTPIALNVSNGELVDFQQTFVMNVTSEGDWGLYTVRLVNYSNWTLASVNIYVTSNSLSFYPTPSVQPSASVYGSTQTSGIPVAVPMVAVIATVAGVAVGGVIVILLVLLSVAVGVAFKRKASKDRSVKPVGALYEDLDGIEPVRTYETITEVNHNKQPVFEFFDELPALVPTIVANPPGQEGFESLYNKDGSIIVKYPDSNASTVCTQGLPCQPYVEPSLSMCSKDGFRWEGDTPLPQSPASSRLPTRPDRSSSSLLLASRCNTAPNSKSSSPLPPGADPRPPQLTAMSDTHTTRSPSVPEPESPGEEEEEVRPPMPVPRGTPLTSRKSSPAASHTTPPCAYPPGYPYSYVSRGDLLVAVRTGSGTFSAHNSPSGSRHCSRENSVSRSSPAPQHDSHAPHRRSPAFHGGSCERLVSGQSSVVSLGSRTLD